MRKYLVSIALAAASLPAAAAPSLIATMDGRGGLNLEFVADAANPVAAFNIELPLRKQKAMFTVSEECIAAPKGFSALCNIDNGVFKAIIFSTNPNAVIPSSKLGRVQLPAGSVSIAKSGELEGLKLSAANGKADAVQGEVLSESSSLSNANNRISQ
jgi:hypothetical protein